MNPPYQEAGQSAVLIEERGRAYFEISGPDCKKYLQGLVTNDVLKLEDRSGCYNLHLTPKGRIVADFYSYSCGDYFGIDVALALKERVFESFKKYIIFQKVELVDQTGVRFPVVVLGPKAKAFLEAHTATLPSENFTYVGTKCGDSDVWIIRRDRWGFLAYEIWERPEKIPLLREKLGLPELDSKTQEILRIESATPLFGVDFDENTLPQEAKLFAALNFNKGCFVGQEIVARLQHRGHVGKQLVQLKLPGDVSLSKRDKIYNSGGEEIGWVTSVCYSFKYQSILALGYLRHHFLNLEKVIIGSVTATVISEPSQ